MSWCRRKLEAFSSAVRGAKELMLFGKRVAPDTVPPHLQMGSSVEVIEKDGRSYVEGTIEDVKISEDMVMVKPSSNHADCKNILVERKRVRPVPNSNIHIFTEGQGLDPQNDSFRIYAIVDVWICDKWMVGVIVQVPTANESSYRVKIFKEKDDFTVLVTSKMRLHFEWDTVKHWTSGLDVPKRLQTSEVGLVGGQRAKILQIFSGYYILVEYIDVKHYDGTCVKEVVNVNKWHKSIWGMKWEEIKFWIVPKHASVQEYGCYLPAYIGLGILGLVSPILFIDSAQSWPDEMVVLFYSLGGISFFSSMLLLIGLMCWQPKTRAHLRMWRAICLFAVAASVTFLALQAFYGRKAFVARRKSC